MVTIVSVVILHGSHGMCDAFKSINNWAGEIVSWISLVLGAMAMMRNINLASVEDWVSQAFELVLHVHFGPNTPTFSLSFKHGLKSLHILLNAPCSSGTLDSVISLVFHLLTCAIITVSIAVLDEFLHVVDDLWEEIRGVADLVRDNIQSFQITLDVLHKLQLFVEGVGVVESEHHLSIVDLGVVVVQHSGLDVTDVKETRWLRRESCDDLAVYGSFEHVFVVCVYLITVICHIFS